jgi:DNA repair protein RadC
MILPNDGFPDAPARAAVARVRHRATLPPNHPATRLAELGPRALSSRELLSVILDGGRGPAWADEAASRITSTLAGEAAGLRRLGAMTLPALVRESGLGPRAASRILAALELGRRATQELLTETDRLATARDVYELLRLGMRDLRQEEFHVLLLDTQCRLLRDVTVTVGTLDSTLVHTREVFRPAITEAAASIILVHNHPSGEPTPSLEDAAITQELFAAGALMRIPVRDHVVIGEGRYFSFAEEGMSPFETQP